jgi:hypothetical protein
VCIDSTLTAKSGRKKIPNVRIPPNGILDDVYNEIRTLNKLQEIQTETK